MLNEDLELVLEGREKLSIRDRLKEYNLLANVTRTHASGGAERIERSRVQFHGIRGSCCRLIMSTFRARTSPHV